jgi:hypothetical protein
LLRNPLHMDDRTLPLALEAVYGGAQLVRVDEWQS